MKATQNTTGPARVERRRARNLAQVLVRFDGVGDAFERRKDHRIIGDIMDRAAQFGSISEAQARLVIRIDRDMTDRESRPVVEVPITEKRIEIKGKIVSIKSKWTQFGHTLKMLVDDERGFRVWGTVPKAIGDAERGSVVTFDARVRQSKDDKGFGFFSRPTNAVELFTQSQNETVNNTKEH